MVDNGKGASNEEDVCNGHSSGAQTSAVEEWYVRFRTVTMRYGLVDADSDAQRKGQDTCRKARESEDTLSVACVGCCFLALELSLPLVLSLAASICR